MSINEWTFFAPVGLIQSASLLGRQCTGFSLMELFHLLALTPLVFSLFPTAFADCLPRPTSAASFPVTRLSPRLWYYTAVRLLPVAAEIGVIKLADNRAALLKG